MAQFIYKSLNVIFGISCSVNIMRVIILAVNPEMPQIEIIEKSLSEIPFPVSFRLCVDGENELIVEFKSLLEIN